MPRATRPETSVNGWNAEYIDALYTQWQAEASSVDPSWQRFFEGFELGAAQPLSERAALPAASGEDGTHVAHSTQGRVDSLIYHYRDNGHLAALLDPLGRDRPYPEQLRLESFGLGTDDLDTHFDPGRLPLAAPATLRDIIGRLECTYCRHIGVEYMHIQNRERRYWLQREFESVQCAPDLDRAERLRILHSIVRADAFEGFLHTRYRGKKRFGLDGGESLIPMLQTLCEAAPDAGIEELTFGMPHRGRLNVLFNVLQKAPAQIFTEFEESWAEDFIEGGGDVKYHRGYSSDYATACGQNLRLTLSPNPSHLEFVNGVVLGRARAKQRMREDTERIRCVPVLMHGDASFPGQGIVAECLNMMRLDGYTVGGTLHFIVNNQVGFTTNPQDAHSGVYCTDLAKMVEAPILHVNGDDPEACVFATRIALAYRQRFKNDVVLDLWCYRRHGHNEGDEPSFTQPLMYERIRDHTPAARLYAERLVSEGVLEQNEYEEFERVVRQSLDEAQSRTKENPVATTVEAFRSSWSGLTQVYHDDPVETSVAREALERIATTLGTVPDDFHPHKKIARLMHQRGSAIAEGRDLDWAMGELLAYGSLLLDGHAVRLTGQDVERGTFSHRHAVVFDQKTGQGYDPLNHLAAAGERFCVHNSPLSESSCLGFEYGYSLGDPNMLVIWEAQFGDFANGAQVIFDQFIASAETKWRRFSGLTVFLPHGYEGQGPEHSSARLERFLALCADDDMQVAYPSSPAQIFHLLRRQMKRDFRKPLIVMTPKSLLRHPKAVSPIEAFTADRFHHLLDDPFVVDPSKVERLLFCTGKIYYDLIAHRDDTGHDDVAIVRVEQLYPLRIESLKPILARYAAATELVWVQEEPKNMGAYRHVDAMLREHLELTVKYVGREAHASPAVASTKMHQQEQHQLMVRAIGLAQKHGKTAGRMHAGSA